MRRPAFLAGRPAGGRHWLIAAACAAAAIGAYAGLAVALMPAAAPREQSFAAAPGAPPLLVYVDVLGVDPVREAMQVRLGFTVPDPPPGDDLTVQLDDGAYRQILVLRAGAPSPPVPLEVSLAGGTINRYPFDRYRAALRVMAAAGTGGAPVPVAATVWEGVADWNVTSAAEGGARQDGIGLRFAVGRPAASETLAVAIYGAMLLVGCAALGIPLLVLTGVRKVEATMTGALAGMVFALPVLRRVLPGAPPIGVRADLLVFLWAELAAVIGLALFVFAWARHGPRP